MNKVKTIVRQIFSLSPPASVVHKVMALVQNPNSSINELSHIIAYDPALTANLLKMANSSYFGRIERIDSVHQACAYLGMNQVIDLVFMNAIAENLASAQTGYDLSKGELWQNSVLSALIARELAEKKKIPQVHLIFTATLLKDIGKIILSQFVNDSFTEINTLVTDQGYSFKEAEKKVLGIDHAELGAMVARIWQFSPLMEDIIRNHHRPRESSIGAVETSIVYMADTLCMMMGVGVGSDGLSYKFHRNVPERLQLTERDIEQIIAGFGEKLQQVEALIDIS